jgi:DNA-binding transcriptional ArsR family regulator
MAASGDSRGRDREVRYRRAAMFHPLRQGIGRLLSGGAETAAVELSAKLGQPLGRIGYHLRVLVKRRVLKVVPKRRPTPPLYRWSEDARWAREMLVEEDEQ